ncbi:fructose-2,6-bisphosphatase TIGAR isoform X1 [Dipodomys merriami]|uniref:fructose-2,6-bisphosphatase TIGAR isoform X1 n=1 Tax=Dipodomys merriami TaxID=94247 RepID=UPI0038559C20
MTRFALTVVRHGETRLNKEKILQGQGVDEPLSDAGHVQAAAAGRFLSRVVFTHAFSSDLTRTKQTIHGILQESEFCRQLTVKYDLRLRERKYGIAEGRALSELRAMAKAAGEQCPAFTPTGGETLAQVKTRGKDFFESLCQLIGDEAASRGPAPPGAPSQRLETLLAEISPPGQSGRWDSNSQPAGPGLAASVLVVTHGAYMRNLFDYFLTDLKCSLPPTLGKFELTSVSPNTGISVFLVSCEEGRRPALQCVCMNLVEHLHEAPDTA